MSFIRRILLMLNREVSTETLVKRGMKCGKNFTRQQGCFIDPSHAWLISIGDNVTFSIRVTVLAHDASTKLAAGYSRIRKVDIGNDVFVGANVTILPGVHIGDRCVVAAGSVVTKDIPSGSVAAGNPARVIATMEEWSKKIKAEFEASEKFSEDYTMRKNVSESLKKEMIEKMADGTAYIE